MTPSEVAAVPPSRTRGHPGNPVTRVVLMLDRSLRKRLGIYEYTTHPDCLFRIEEARADQTVCLHDGTLVCRGDPVLKLHLWNEQWPTMGSRGATVAWACRVRRDLRISLQELARYLAERPARYPGVPICADMRLACARDSGQLSRIVTGLGFESQRSPDARPGRLHRFGEIILMCLLMLATNPAALRCSSLRRNYMRIYLSPTTLARRYGTRKATQTARGNTPARM